ncbi:fructose-1,6-bisphosphatase, class II [Methylobacterium sp. 4-46]|uniref:class II fructose-bisphosphatase n=1 Tax=unclassified Methylobacterium TaxID=2615210 RepID=UPI000165C748|nr:MULTISPECIES: class II fructose-bisphosphatase [Methylobacterium]ACA17136.1 fructose-1,6-bisphosphatase, class II [Methylobacterium sp. 4-46]WFT82820.1 class II fructose-bisphosphatase [Methylobacterium nodulans]
MSDATKAAPSPIIERILTLELVRVTERAAVAAARLRGQGNEKAADQAAVDAMRRELNRLPIAGTVVIGEGERDEAPMLFIGETLGNGQGPKVDIAVDPLEGTTLCAKDMPGSVAVMAMAEGGTLLAAPDVYMHKIAVGPGYPRGVVDLDASPEDNIQALAKAKGVPPSEITALVLDRPRHTDLIAAIRRTGAGVRLISDGDVAGVIFTTMPEETGIDIYLGIGAAPEGVLAAGALRCIGGQMQGRLILDTQEKRDRAAKMGVQDPNRRYDLEDLARGDVVVALTGVTDGALVKGVRFGREVVQTDTIVYRSHTGTVRRIQAEHRDFTKFHLK